jgi:energy-converting hydrogenase Eha subunit C
MCPIIQAWRAAESCGKQHILHVAVIIRIMAVSMLHCGGQHEVCMGYTCVAQVATLVWPFCPVLLLFGPFSFLYLIRSLFICLNKIPGISNYL